MAFLRAVLVLSVAALASASWFSSGSTVAKPLWTDLKVTFGINPLKSFKNLPRTLAAATKDGWVPIDSAASCDNGGKWNGQRYMLAGDSSLTLLFDKQGTIAGLQMNTLKSDVASENNQYDYSKVSMFVADKINDQDVYITTAYFVDPETICSAGRSEEQLNTEGTGTGLFLQNGLTPKELILAPLKRKAAIAEGWTKNRCFVMMGYHNFFESEKYGDHNCTDYRPAFLLFNNEGAIKDGVEEESDLHGFGLSATGHATSVNSRFEYPSAAAIKQIVGEDRVSQCLIDQANTVGLTTMHIYFTDWNIKHTCL